MYITYVLLCIKHVYMYITYNLRVHTWRHVTLIIKLGRIFKPANLGIRKEQRERTVMMKMVLMRVAMMMMMMLLLLVMIMTMLTMMTMFMMIMMMLTVTSMSLMIMMMTMMMNSWARRKRSWRIVN